MKHLPWLLLAAVLVYPLLAQGTVGSISLLRGQVYGIPHPDEWIDIESNEVGQPATQFTVPDGHRLTLVGVLHTPFPPDSSYDSTRIIELYVDGNAFAFTEGE